MNIYEINKILSKENSLYENLFTLLVYHTSNDII